MLPQYYVSTGHLPSTEPVKSLVLEAYERFKLNTEGENSKVYPALEVMPREMFGICVAGVLPCRTSTNELGSKPERARDT